MPLEVNVFNLLPGAPRIETHCKCCSYMEKFYVYAHAKWVSCVEIVLTKSLKNNIGCQAISKTTSILPSIIIPPHTICTTYMCISGTYFNRFHVSRSSPSSGAMRIWIVSSSPIIWSPIQTMLISVQSCKTIVA